MLTEFDSKKTHITFQEVYYTREFKKRFISSFSEAIDRMVICSPYIGRLFSPFNSILEFCRTQISRGTREIQIITCPPGSGNSTISKETARHLESQGVEIFIRMSPNLHAKLYHFEYIKGYFRSFVGSSNFSLGGFENNHELVAEIEGVGENTPFHREIDRLLGKGTQPYRNWIITNASLGSGEEDSS